MKLVVDYGQDPVTRQWGCPLLWAWGLSPHQKLTLAYAEKLCFTVTATGSYAEAAQVASKWASSMDDSTLHALVQRTGARAESQAQSRYQTLPQERLPQRGPTELGVLLVDGCQMRYRGPGWGKKKTQQARVEWHELKLGVFYRHEAAAPSEADLPSLPPREHSCPPRPPAPANLQSPISNPQFSIGPRSLRPCSVRHPCLT